MHTHPIHTCTQAHLSYTFTHTYKDKYIERGRQRDRERRRRESIAYFDDPYFQEVMLKQKLVVFHSDSYSIIFVTHIAGHPRN